MVRAYLQEDEDALKDGAGSAALTHEEQAVKVVNSGIMSATGAFHFAGATVWASKPLRCAQCACRAELGDEAAQDVLFFRSGPEASWAEADYAMPVHRFVTRVRAALGLGDAPDTDATTSRDSKKRKR